MRNNRFGSVFIIDPLEDLDRQTDTSLAFMRESLLRQHRVGYCTLGDLRLDGGEPRAQVHAVGLSQGKEIVSVGPPQDQSLNDVDILYMRKDPPVNNVYLNATLVLDRLAANVLQVNPAKALRNHCEKLIPLEFPSIIPETVVTSSAEILGEFLDKFGHIVIKPLNECSGRGIFSLIHGDSNRNSIFDQTTAYGTQYVLGQRFLPEITQGDKRILLLDGEILGWIRRVPQKSDFRSNVNAGGHCVVFEMGKEERSICDQVGQWLKHENIHLAGIDIVGNYLLEVNITSPSCLREINDLTGEKLEKRVLDYLEERCRK